MSNLKIPKNVKIIVSDFDGIMTDNCVYIDEDLKISRKVNFKDIMAVSLLRKANFELGFISGENNPIMELLKEKFNLEEIHQNIRCKIDVLKDIASRKNLKPEEILYIGDDINDIDCLNFAGVKITVPNSTYKVKLVENIQLTSETGGNGAFREVVDCLLNS